MTQIWSTLSFPEMYKHGKRWHCWNLSCYYFHNNEQVTKDVADERCDALGAHVLAVESAAEGSFVWQTVEREGERSLCVRQWRGKVRGLCVADHGEGR